VAAVRRSELARHLAVQEKELIERGGEERPRARGFEGGSRLAQRADEKVRGTLRSRKTTRR
jgi:hypothetical protein